MKSNIYGALTIFALALMISVPMAQAQIRAKADVPFQFSLNQYAMTAGNYEISSPGENVLVVRNLDTTQGRLLIASMRVRSNHVEHPKLVFRKYGDQYFLAEIWDGRSDTGLAFAESKHEKELRASNSAKAELVIVAMK